MVSFEAVGGGAALEDSFGGDGVYAVVTLGEAYSEVPPGRARARDAEATRARKALRKSILSAYRFTWGLKR
jgi:hypothetical protein